MSIQDLRGYIQEFQDWIERHALQVLPSDQAGLIAGWREELAAAGRLLEKTPELPIALLGPSQQGKSSLINAILGENILAVGGAVGACTCVITSVHYRAAPGFRGQISFISMEDWKAELAAIQHELSSCISEEDSALDREEMDLAHSAALEKFRAVYRSGPPKDLRELLNDPNLGLPSDIVRSMSAGTPVVLEEAAAQTLRNKVRRYLVGREQSGDGQFWPLISRVRIHGRFEVLNNGVVLVDLPGLNDPNPAREQVTKRYLEDARYIWLVCNSQTGIDRVFTQVLRENAFLLRLFLEGRMDAFSVVATRADDINLEAVLEQMGISPDEYDGNHSAPLEFRRKQIASYIQEHLLEIARDIAAKAQPSEHREAFFERVRSIPAFSVSTAAYLNAVGRMPLYTGMKLTPEESHIPQLIAHLHSITLEHSYKTQVQASARRMELLYDQVRRFFLNQIRRVEEDNEQAGREWERFCQLSESATQEGRIALQQIQARAEESLRQRCSGFEQRLGEIDGRAASSLASVFKAWDGINWRSLQAAVARNGEWFSRSTRQEFNFNRDIAMAYLDQLPFVWEEFFGAHLSALVKGTANQTQQELKNSAHTLLGGIGMLRHQPDGIRESMETTLNTSEESFTLQSDQIRADLTAQIQRTRQALVNGMEETAAAFMRPAYESASQDPGGTGVKRRILDVLVERAQRHAPGLFINMRQELTEGVSTLAASMKPELCRIVKYGVTILDQFRQNMATHQVLTPEQRGGLQSALDELPRVSLISV